MDPRTVRMLEGRPETAAPSSRRGPLFSPDAKDWLTANWFRASLALAIVVVALSVGFYTTVTLPALRREELAAQQDADRRRGIQAIYSTQSQEMCLDAASQNYSADWEGECKSRNMGTDCRLPGVVADKLGDRKREARDECLKRYPSR